MQIRISIIVPTYNVAPYIRECLESVASQTYTGPIECLIVDDCGTDNSILIAEEFIQKYQGTIVFRIIYREKNGGLSAARNTGIREAKGDYLYFLDADDKIFPNAIDSLVSLTEKYPGVNMIQGNRIAQDGNTRWTFNKDTFPEYSDDREWIRDSLLKREIEITAWNKLIRREYVENNKMEFLEGVINEDVKWCFDNQKYIRSIAISPIVCYWYRTDNDTSIMHDVDKTKSVLSFLRIIECSALQICDQKEKMYLENIVAPFLKESEFPKCKDLKNIESAIKRVKRSIKGHKYCKKIHSRLSYLQLPIWITSFKYFTRAYFLYERIRFK